MLRHKRLSCHLAAGVGPGKQADKLRGLSAPAATNFKSDNDKAAAMTHRKSSPWFAEQDGARLPRRAAARGRLSFGPKLHAPPGRKAIGDNLDASVIKAFDMHVQT